MEVPAGRFIPPFCPRSDCRHHRCSLGWRYRRHGWFLSQASPRPIPRFRCGHCGHTFSSQTFSTTYWLRRPDVLLEVAFATNACAGHRQAARKLRCSPTTVQRHVGRLGRHALLLLQESAPDRLDEPVVIDGFESFAYSQYHPLYLNLVVGADSHYCYAFTHSELRRKGRMTQQQHRRRARLEAEFGRPDPKAIELGTYRALQIAAPRPQALVARTDEHDAYPRAFHRLRQHDITHERTSSKEARSAGNPLFPVNRLDLLIRHNSANHKRETIAFSKRHQAVIWRAAWLIAMLNYAKQFSERHGGGTPAMRAGICDRPVPIPELVRWRRFPSRVGLPEEWKTYYEGRVRTRRFAREQVHDLTLAG